MNATAALDAVYRTVDNVRVAQLNSNFTAASYEVRVTTASHECTCLLVAQTTSPSDVPHKDLITTSQQCRAYLALLTFFSLAQSANNTVASTSFVPTDDAGLAYPHTIAEIKKLLAPFFSQGEQLLYANVACNLQLFCRHAPP